MSSVLQDLKARALALDPRDRDDLLRTLIISLDGEPGDTSENIAKAWDEEIGRRVAELEAGKVTGIPAERVLAEVRDLISGTHHGK